MLLHIELRQLERLGVDRVGLRQRHHAVLHTQQLQDPQVLLTLGHPPFGGGDDEEHRVYGTDAGQHVLDEAHVSRHVDEADIGARGQAAERKPEVDRQPAGLLLREAVGVRTGERQDERRLAVVDVARGRHGHHRLSGRVLDG